MQQKNEQLSEIAETMSKNTDGNAPVLSGTKAVAKQKKEISAIRVALKLWHGDRSAI